MSSNQNDCPSYLKPVPDIPNLSTEIKKKKKYPFFIGGLSLLFLLALCVYLLLQFSISDKGKVSKAFIKTFQEASLLEHPSLIEHLGISQIQDLAAWESEVSLNLEDIHNVKGFSPAILKGLGFYSKSQVDSHGKMAQNKLRLSYGTLFSLSSISTYQDGSYYVEAPKLWDGSIVFQADNIKTQYESSILNNDYPFPFENNFSLNPFQYKTTLDKKPTLDEFLLEHKRELFSLWKSAQVSSQNKTEEILLGEDAFLTKKYTITFPKSHCQPLLESFSSYFSQEDSIQLSNDLTIHIWVTKDHLIKKFSLQNSLLIDHYPMEIHLLLSGSELFTDNGELRIKTTDRNNRPIILSLKSIRSIMEDSSIKYAHTFSYSKGSEEIVTLKGIFSWNPLDDSLSMDLFLPSKGYHIHGIGNFENVNKGQSFFFNAKELSIKFDEIDLSLSGKFSIAPLEEPLKAPSPASYQLFQMAEKDFQDLGEEIKEHIHSMIDSYSFF